MQRDHDRNEPQILQRTACEKGVDLSFRPRVWDHVLTPLSLAI
jgi:hypothetical protein